MAQWKGEADPKEASGGSGNFTPAPRGIYTIQVADYKDGITQETKRPTVNLECEISDEGEYFGKKVWMSITQIPKGEKGHGFMVRNLHAFGVALDGNYDFDTNDLQGKSARVLLGVTQREKVKDGRTYINDVNWIEDVYTTSNPEPDPTMLPPAKQPRQASPAKATTAAGNVPANVKAAFPNARPAKKELDEVPF